MERPGTAGNGGLTPLQLPQKQISVVGDSQTGYVCGTFLPTLGTAYYPILRVDNPDFLTSWGARAPGVVRRRPSPVASDERRRATPMHRTPTTPAEAGRAPEQGTSN